MTNHAYDGLKEWNKRNRSRPTKPSSNLLLGIERLQRLHDLAEHNGVTKSAIVRDLIDKLFEKLDREGEVSDNG